MLEAAGRRRAGARRPGAVVLGAVAAAVFLLDQATKAWALSALTPGRPIELLPVFDLALGFNRGVVFGLFSSDHPAGPWLLSGATGLITAGLVVWMLVERAPRVRAGLALVVGGALSNLVDRAADGAVTDFLDAHAGGLHWPAFNLADAAIVCGVGLLLWASLRPAPGRPR